VRNHTKESVLCCDYTQLINDFAIVQWGFWTACGRRIYGQGKIVSSPQPLSIWALLICLYLLMKALSKKLRDYQLQDTGRNEWNRS
jgi:hypothetical protein